MASADAGADTGRNLRRILYPDRGCSGRMRIRVLRGSIYNQRINMGKTQGHNGSQHQLVSYHNADNSRCVCFRKDAHHRTASGYHGQLHSFSRCFKGHVPAHSDGNAADSRHVYGSDFNGAYSYAYAAADSHRSGYQSYSLRRADGCKHHLRNAYSSSGSSSFHGMRNS